MVKRTRIRYWLQTRNALRLYSPVIILVRSQWQSPTLPTSDDIIARERQIAQQERQRADSNQQQLNNLLAKLQESGINLDVL